MKKAIFTSLLLALLSCLCISCSDNENDEPVYDLDKFSEIEYNTTLLRVNDKTRKLDSCRVVQGGYGYYIFIVYNEKKQEILSFNFHPEHTEGDSIASMPTINYYENSDTIRYGVSNNAAIKLYHYKRINKVYDDIDSVYIDAVFHIKVNGDKIKDIKGQMNFKGAFSPDDTPV